LALLTQTFFSYANGHAFLFNPPSRNYKRHVSGVENCPHCLQAGGPGNVQAKAHGIWPDRLAYGSHGLCGDPGQNEPEYSGPAQEPHMVPTDVGKAVYKAGQVVEFEVHVNAHHMGHYEFRICDHGIDGRESNFTAASGQQCLDRRVLERAPLHESCTESSSDPYCQPIDPKHPGRWYIPPLEGSATPLSDTSAWKDSMASPAGLSGVSVSATHKMRYLLPPDLSCSHCTLQWYWSTGNSCLYDADYWTYFQSWPGHEAWCPKCYSRWETCDNSCCGVGSGWAEEFWNCADMQVLTADAFYPSPQPSPTAPSTQIPTPSSTPPTHFPTPLPTTQPTGALPKPGAQRACDNGDGSCKDLCYKACGGAVQINQCWGAPRFIQCTCGNGANQTFDGCPCEHTMCPSQPDQPLTPEPTKAEPDPTPAPEHVSTTPPTQGTESTTSLLPPTPTPEVSKCGSCAGCLFSNNVCYSVSKEYCDSWPSNTWCASASASALLQVGRRQEDTTSLAERKALQACSRAARSATVAEASHICQAASI